MSDRDFVNIYMYHEVVLCQKLGYSVFCRLEGIAGDMTVDDARYVGGDGANLEVLTIYGWRKPSKCWALGPDVAIKVQVENEHQLGLFK